jgi:hypothetical protein
MPKDRETHAIAVDAVEPGEGKGCFLYATDVILKPGRQGLYGLAQGADMFRGRQA